MLWIKDEGARHTRSVNKGAGRYEPVALSRML